MSPTWLIAAFHPVGPWRAPLRQAAHCRLFPALPDAQHPNGKSGKRCVTAMNREEAHKMEVPKPIQPCAANNRRVTLPSPSKKGLTAPLQLLLVLSKSQKPMHLAESAKNDLTNKAEQLSSSLNKLAQCWKQQMGCCRCRGEEARAQDPFH